MKPSFRGDLSEAAFLAVKTPHVAMACRASPVFVWIVRQRDSRLTLPFPQMGKLRLGPGHCVPGHPRTHASSGYGECGIQSRLSPE